MSAGGFTQKIVRKDGTMISKPGYVWTEWETGTRSWVEYLNDEVSSSNIQVGWDEHMQIERFMEQPPVKAKPIPDILKGISRYMLVEYLGDTVIDIGPRHLGEEPKESVMQDYKKFDPTYDYIESSGYRTDYFPTQMQRVLNKDKSYSWKECDIFAQRKIYK